MKLKLMNTSISLLKDANPKIVMLGFDILSLLITQYGDSFQALVNMSFDTLFLKFCDNKVLFIKYSLCHDIFPIGKTPFSFYYYMTYIRTFFNDNVLVWALLYKAPNTRESTGVISCACKSRWCSSWH